MRAWLWVAMAVGCSNGYDVRIDVTPTALEVGVYTDDCGCSEPPPVGECVFTGDVGPPSCACHDAGCVTDLRLEVGGRIVDEVTVDPTAVRPVRFQTMPAGTDLVLAGCGPDVRISLPATLPTPPMDRTAHRMDDLRARRRDHDQPWYRRVHPDVHGRAASRSV